MKVLASDTWAGQIEGHPAEINFVVYADQVAEGRGEVDVSLCQAGRTEAPQLLIGTFQLFLRDFDTPWLQRFWSLYQHNSAFRREVDAFYCLAAYQTPVIQQSISLPRAEATITVDSPLANAIWALNAQGFETLASSAGGAYRKAFVTARHLPRELEEVAQAAGFAVANGTLSTDVPFCQPLAAEAASQSLVQMLHDWSQGELRQASTYQSYRAHVRSCSLVRLPSGTVPSKPRAEPIAALVRKSLAGKAGVSDYAQLRSGRDDYTRMKSADLLRVLELPSLPASLRDRDPAWARRVLRWMARGLSEGMALQKVAVDEAMTDRAREKSKREKGLDAATSSSSESPT